MNSPDVPIDCGLWRRSAVDAGRVTPSDGAPFGCTESVLKKICTVFSSTGFYYSTPGCRNVRSAALPFHMLGCACLHIFRAGTPWNTLERPGTPKPSPPPPLQAVRQCRESVRKLRIQPQRNISGFSPCDCKYSGKIAASHCDATSAKFRKCVFNMQE